MSTTRLTRALEDLQTQLARAGQDYHPEWDGADGVIVVRIGDEQGPLPVGAFASWIAAAWRNQEALRTPPLQHTVSALLLVWDGSELIADESVELIAALGSPGTRRGTRRDCYQPDRVADRRPHSTTGVR